MQNRTSVQFALLLLLLIVSMAEGQQLVNNFPVNGQISAFQVNGGYSASVSFTLSANASISGASFGAWLNRQDSVTGIQWSIGTAPYGSSSGTGAAAASSTFNFSNADGYDVNTVSFPIPNLTLPAGTYYLTLSAAVSAAGNPVYWDINNAAGADAWDSSYGHVSASNTCFQVVGISGTCAPSFQILGANATLIPSASSITFANQTVNTTSAAQTITVTNSGSNAVTINSIAVSGSNPADFAQTNNCPISPATLAAGGFCSISVTFTPQAASARSAAIAVSGSSPLLVALSGTGTAVPSTVTLSSSSVAFANQTVNTASGAQTITVTNSGPSALTISNIAVSGTNPGDFTQTNNCPVSPAAIAASGFCTINVTFTPQAASARSAAVTIMDNGVGSPQSVGLSGTGLASAAWPNGYTYRATFTVAAGQAPNAQTNFPALISGTFPDFATTANGGRISNTCTQVVGNNSTPVPCDLIFTSDAAGTIPLSWEFETYAAATGAVNIWVNVPSLASGTAIYAWYGNSSVATLQTTPAATWNSNFEAVYHLKENPAGTAPQMNDSTANANHATMNGAVQASQQQPGEIDGSVNFEGNTWASLANPANFSFERTDSFTTSGWFKIASNSSGNLLGRYTPAPADQGWMLIQFPGASNPSVALLLSGTSGGILAETPPVTTGVWHYLVATYSGTGTAAGVDIYIDGVNQSLTALSNNLTSSIVNAATPTINGRGGPNQMSTDSMDEIRISTKGAVFPAGWVTASYNNQSNPGAFFTATTGLTNSGNQPVVTVSPASIVFPNQTANTTSAAQTFTVTNSGPNALAISGIAVSGMNSGDFAQTNNCPLSPATIAVSGFCTVNVTFTPQAASAHSAAVTITDNGAGSPQSVGLSGTGTPVPSTVTLSSSSITFANQAVNATSAAQTFTVTNSGSNALAISSIAVSGVNPGDFAQTNNCPISPATLAASSFCTINVTFTPSAATARSAAIMIADNGAGSPQSVGLSGTGTPVPPTVTLSSSSVTFANQTVNTTSAAQTITVTNSGPNALAISNLALSGTNPGDFAQTNNCPISPATIAAGGFCTISVTFKPQLAGLRSAAYTIADNGAGSQQSGGLSGTGVASAAWPNGYTYQATFTVAAGQAPNAQTNFAALIAGTFPDFAVAANGGRIANTCTQTVGNNSTAVPCDLIFTSDAAGTIPLNWEFETYAAATGAVNIWVDVPSLSSGTAIYAWYGNSSVTTLQTTPTSTWNTNFEAVYHLKENPAGTAPQMNDSTANANHATMNGTVQASQQQPGEIAGSVNFEGNTWASLANPANFSFERTDSFTISGWFKMTSNSSGNLLGRYTPAPANQGWMLIQFPGAGNPSVALLLSGTSGGILTETPPVTTGVWHYLVATYSGTSTAAGVEIYIDGVNQSLTALSNNLTSSIVNAATPAINGRGGPNQMSTDSMDEIRISTKGAVFLAGWVTASYNNQSNPGAFFTVATGLTSH